MTKIAVIGSRTFSNYPQFCKIMHKLISSYDNQVELISGGADGADSMAKQFSEEFYINIDVFPAEWDKYGKSAGYRRNHTIWENSDIGIAFWDGKSKGTAHSFDIAKSQKKTLYVFNYLTNKWIKS